MAALQVLRKLSCSVWGPRFNHCEGVQDDPRKEAWRVCGSLFFLQVNKPTR